MKVRKRDPDPTSRDVGTVIAGEYHLGWGHLIAPALAASNLCVVALQCAKTIEPAAVIACGFPYLHLFAPFFPTACPPLSLPYLSWTTKALILPRHKAFKKDSMAR